MRRTKYNFQEQFLKNGSILKASIGNVECFDISKHITGTLKQNLEELKFSIRNEEFGYGWENDWSRISYKDQQFCIEYLKEMFLD